MGLVEKNRGERIRLQLKGVRKLWGQTTGLSGGLSLMGVKHLQWLYRVPQCQLIQVRQFLFKSARKETRLPI